MNNITPEMLKVVAEGMGHITHTLKSEPNVIWICKNPEANKAGWSYKKYTPHLTNAEQCMEIMEKLLSEGWWFEKDHDNYALCDGEGDTIYAKTLNEAVVLAAYEVFK